MLTSVRWLNRYLDPAGVTADEADHVLTHVGFPIEGREDVGEGDVRLDVELTSNRGDCLCHVGLAREVAAATGRTLVLPESGIETGGGSVGDVVRLENRVVDRCPRFTARVIRGVRVGPSPEWLRRALEAIGLTPINNVVDVSNYVLFELGHPNHVFDLGKLRGGAVVVREAEEGERVLGLDGREHALKRGELVVADAERAVSIAGVVGGEETGVTEGTTDVLLEVATWDPVAVRSVSRRLGIRTDAGHRFERYVDARDVEWASRRCARLIREVAGGEILEGVLDEGAPAAGETVVDLRVRRCHHLLGIEPTPGRMAELLGAIGVGVEEREGRSVLRCTIPHHRHDLTREVDLVEEVARLHGFEEVTLAPRLDVHLELDHPAAWSARERATGVIGEVLTGLGFYETVTFSFLPEGEAAPFVPIGLRLLKVDEERRKGAPYLRPSVVPSLLEVRKSNQDGRVRVDGGVRLFEMASVFAEEDDGDRYLRRTVERRVLTVVADSPAGGGKAVERGQAGLRLVRGAVEAVIERLSGAGGAEVVEMERSPFPAAERERVAAVVRGGEMLGVIGWLDETARSGWGLEEGVAFAELDLSALIAMYPPAPRAHTLPRYPGIERDISVVVDESRTWGEVERVLEGVELSRLERREFVGVYRGKPLERGRKSVTFRLHFRDPERTLRHEEVDPEVDQVVKALSAEIGAELRA